MPFISIRHVKQIDGEQHTVFSSRWKTNPATSAACDSFGKFFSYALGEGAIGFSPFGVDRSGCNILGEQPWKAHANNFALIGTMRREIAQLELDGKLKTAVEEPGRPRRKWISGHGRPPSPSGFPRLDGRTAPGTKDAHAAALVAQLGPDEFLVTGVDASVSFLQENCHGCAVKSSPPNRVFMTTASGSR
jgi:hypothetical protein